LASNDHHRHSDQQRQYASRRTTTGRQEHQEAEETEGEERKEVMIRKTTDFPQDVIIAARNIPIVYECMHYYLNGTWTEYEALTKMVYLLAKENSELREQLTEEIQRRPAQVDPRLLK
jgi:hypothetical protein